MADIELILDGDASGATGALNSTGEATQSLAKETGRAVVSYQELANGAKRAIEAVVRFGIESVKAYAEAERIQRQLVRVAGEYADALSDVAEEQSKLNAVDDDTIKQSQTLLVQWAGLGAATKETTQAVLDYAAATGTDAVSATRELIRNVESGGVGLAKLGVHFKDTGDKGKNLENAVAALSAKFGGAGAADAGSLSGSLRGVNLAFEDFQKSVGGALGMLLEKSQILPTITESLRDMAKGAQVVSAVFKDLPSFLGEVVKGKGQATAAVLAEANKAIDAIMSQGSAQLPGIDTVRGATNKALREAEAAEAKTPGKYIQEETAEVVDAMAQQSAAIQAQIEEQLQAEKTMRDQARAAEASSRELEDKAVLESYKAERKAQDAHLKEMLKMEEEATKQAAANMKKREGEWARAADAIGAAFVNALADQLAKLAEGGELDPALFVGEILAATVGTAATIIGTAAGAPAVGAAIGNLAAMGIRAGASGISSASRRSARTYHDGGPIGDWPRMHSGGGLGPNELPIIAERGEYMFSKDAVARNGGMESVHAMAKGGGARVVMNVTALDAKSIAELGERSLSKGIKQALRTGRGDFPKLLGSPR